MAKYSKDRVEEIREHLAELSRRGVPVAQYAAEIGVSAWTVYTWKKRFGSGRTRKRRDVARRADLVEVSRRAPADAIEIQLGPVTVRVPAGVDADDLRRVLEVARSC
jgi:hypothetical protein